MSVEGRKLYFLFISRILSIRPCENNAVEDDTKIYSILQCSLSLLCWMGKWEPVYNITILLTDECKHCPGCGGRGDAGPRAQFRPWQQLGVSGAGEKRKKYLISMKNICMCRWQWPAPGRAPAARTSCRCRSNTRRLSRWSIGFKTTTVLNALEHRV